jgi:hypothetical protein
MMMELLSRIFYQAQSELVHNSNPDYRAVIELCGEYTYILEQAIYSNSCPTSVKNIKIINPLLTEFDIEDINFQMVARQQVPGCSIIAKRIINGN